MPLNFHAVSEQAKRHTQKGQHDKAIDLWNEYLETASDSEAGNAHNIVGDLCLKRKDPVTAIDHFLKASHAFERSGYPLKAIATLKKVIKLEPTRSEVFLRLGDLNARRDMIGNAVEAYLTVVKLMTERDQQEPALELIKRVCVLDPVNIRHRLQVASELFQLGYTRQAMEETVNAVDLYLEQGNLEEAERYCRHLLDLDMEYQPAQERVEKIAAAGRDGYDDAFNGGDSAIDDLFAELDGLMEDATPSAAPADPDTNFNDLLEPTGVGDTGSEAPDPLLGLDDDGPFADFDGDDLHDHSADLRQLAFKHLDSGEFEASLEKFDQFVTEAIANGEYQEADAALKAYIAIDPDNPVAHEVRLRIYQGRDREMENEILEHLVTLWKDVDEGKASEYDQRLTALNDPNADHADVADYDDPFADALELSGGPADLSAGDTDDGSDGDNDLVFDIPGLEADGEGGRMMIQLDADLQGDDSTEAASEDADGENVFSFELDQDAQVDDLLVGATDDTASSEDDESTPEWQLDAPDTDAPDATENLFRIQLDDTSPDSESDALSQAVEDAADSPAEPALEEGDPFAVSFDADGGEPVSEAEQPGSGTPETSSFAPEESTESASGDLLNFQSALNDVVEAAAPTDDTFDLKEALAEAAFYAHQNLTDEAVTVYRDILAHDPGNEVALARLADLGVDVPEAVAPEAPAGPIAADAPEAPEDTGTSWKPMPSVDQALSGSIHTPLGTRAVTHVRDDNAEWEGDDEFADFTSEVQSAFESDGDEGHAVSEDSQLSEILTAFRDGIKEQVDDEDSETHYDLGVAYREMGLLEEAVGEFQMAVKGAMRYADSAIALAECFEELGRDHLAVGHLRRALERSDNGPDQWIALAYQLANALERSGEAGEAKRLYEEVYSRDIGFRDVAQKVSELG